MQEELDLEAIKVWKAFKATFEDWWGVGYIVKGTAFIVVPAYGDYSRLVWDEKLEFIAQASGRDKKKAIKAQRLKIEEFVKNSVKDRASTEYEREKGVDVKICGLAPMLRENYAEDTIEVVRKTIRDNEVKIRRDAQQAMDIVRKGGFKVQGTFLNFENTTFMGEKSEKMQNLVVEELKTEVVARK
ncbi:hypothetical protein EYC84_004248 [Monilinia fructicola]|uniref:Uncharacterized protein n=1 Tax=Monilinia fructicola TaxID=38448 RepID=A0A5M9K2I7_MONFR|nr:hypothetical protein EYC84_004248 [Monilinia fructicola]